MTERVLTAPTDPMTAPVRSTIVDIVKGIAITLVVYGHTAQGMFHRGWWTGPGAVLSDSFVYSFHMPSFFFAAGLFLTGSMARRGPGAYTVDKMKTVLYPYVVWAVLGTAIDPFLSRFKSAVVEFDGHKALIDILTGNIGWFLSVLFVCQMLALLTWKMPNWLRLVVALAVAMVTPSTFGPMLVWKTASEFCFVAAGMMVGRSIFRLKELPVWGAVVGAVTLFGAQLSWIRYNPYATYQPWAAVVLGFLGIAGLLCVARLLDRTTFGGMWVWIGQGSLAVYVLSEFPQGFARELLVRVGHTHEIWLQLIVPTVVATLLAAVVWHQQERWRIGWLFRWPGR